jgi:hypothetical protein
MSLNFIKAWRNDKYNKRGLRLLGNIETFEMDKYYKLFPDLVEKIH